MKIAKYERTVRDVAPQLNKLDGMNVPTSAAMFGGGKAADYSKLASGLMTVSDTSATIADDIFETNARDAANRFQQSFLQWQSEQQKKQGKHGMNSEADYAAWQKAKYEEISKDLNGVERARFQSMADPHNARQANWAANYGHTEKTRYEDGVFEATLATQADSILKNFSDPVLVEAGMLEIGAAIKARNEKLGVSAEKTELDIKEVLEKSLVPAIELQIAEGRLGMASQRMKLYSPMLGEKAKVVLGKQIKNEQKRMAAEARANAREAQAEARYQANLIRGNIKDEIYLAQANGNTKNLRAMQSELVKYGDEKGAETLGKQIDIVEANAETIEKVNTLTVNEMEKNYADLQEERKKTTDVQQLRLLDNKGKIYEEAYKNRVKQFKDDPAAAVAKSVPKSMESRADVSATRLKIQEENGLPVERQKILTNNEAANLQRSWNAGGASQKIAIAQNISKEYGKYAPKVLSEMGISKTEQNALEKAAQDPRYVGNLQSLLAAGDVKDDEAKGVKSVDIQEVLDSSKAFAVTQGMLSLMPQSVGVRNNNSDMLDKTKKLLYLHGNDVGKVTEILDSSYDNLTDGNFMLGYDKDRIDGDILENGLDGLRSREALGKFIANRSDIKSQEKEDYVRHLHNNGIWVNAPQGGYMLIDSVTRQPLRDGDGVLYIVNDDVVKKIGAENLRIDEMNVHQP